MKQKVVIIGSCDHEMVRRLKAQDVVVEMISHEVAKERGYGEIDEVNRIKMLQIRPTESDIAWDESKAKNRRGRRLRNRNKLF